MSRFGERHLGLLDPLYCPHAVDTSIFKPLDKRKVRDQFPGRVRRRDGRRQQGPPQPEGVRPGAARHLQAHGGARQRPLYLHTCLDPNIGQGVEPAALLRTLGVSLDSVKIADQCRLLYAPRPPGRWPIYSALDVLLNPQPRRGVRIPVLEAQPVGCRRSSPTSPRSRRCAARAGTSNTTPYWTGLSVVAGRPRRRQHPRHAASLLRLGFGGAGSCHRARAGTRSNMTPRRVMAGVPAALRRRPAVPRTKPVRVHPGSRR